jgi:hypothetical protein
VFEDVLARIHDDPDHSSPNRVRSWWAGQRLAGSCSYHSRNETRSSGSSAHVVRTPESGESMKKKPEHPKTAAVRKAPRRQERAASEDELRPHYDLDYSKSRPSRFASRFSEGAIAVVLDSDVASVFRSSDAVNSFLRSAISAMSEVETREKKRAG